MKKLKLNKKSWAIFTVIVIVSAAFLFPQTAAWAQDSGSGTGWVTWLIGGLAQGIASILGWILVKLMAVLIQVAQYNNFIKSAAIVNGWVIARDISNMFFVVILLIIAFATILRIENYSYKKWLPKLILMAILINFSKTICGLLIDLSQVVMLTFVNAFKDVAAGSLVDMLGITGWQSLNGIKEVGGWTVASAYVLSVIYLVITLITITAMVGMLVMRIVMIWVYVVLSPFAYLTAAFPGGAKFSSEWWSEFTKNLITGPVLAFFIWLSFTSLVSFSDKGNDVVGDFKDTSQDITCDIGADGECVYGTSDLMIKFIIAIAMLLGGMKVAQEIGGSAASFAGSIASKGNKLAIGAAAGAGLLAWKGAKGSAGWANDKFLQEKGIVDLNLKRVWTGLQARRKEKKNDQYVRGVVNAADRMNKGGFSGVMAMTAGPADAWDRLSDWKGIKPVGIIKQLKGAPRMRKVQDQAIADKAVEAKELERESFESNYMSASIPQQQKMRDDVDEKMRVAYGNFAAADAKVRSIDTEIARENGKGQYKDEDKLAELQKSKLETEAERESAKEERNHLGRIDTWARDNETTIFTDKDKFEARQQVKQRQTSVDALDKKASDNIPKYARQARLAEQTAVQKKMGDLRDIDDPSELFRMLKGAIGTRDKNMIKAVMLKMAKDVNDNEFLQPLAGRTDHVGLKDMMRQLSTKGAKNYAGFNEQESFALGSQVAEINKGTNHWGATSAYLMEDGRWRETTDKEHNEIRDVETGKQQLQAFIRNNNRLAYGYHDEGGDFHLDVGGVLKLQAINNAPGIKNIETMNESAAKHVYDALQKPENAALLREFSVTPDGAKDSLINTIKERLGNIATIENFDQKYNNAKSFIS